MVAMTTSPISNTLSVPCLLVESECEIQGYVQSWALVALSKQVEEERWCKIEAHLLIIKRKSEGHACWLVRLEEIGFVPRRSLPLARKAMAHNTRPKATELYWKWPWSMTSNAGWANMKKKRKAWKLVAICRAKHTTFSFFLWTVTR